MLFSYYILCLKVILYIYTIFIIYLIYIFFFFSSRRRHTRCLSDWSSDVCSSDLGIGRKKAEKLVVELGDRFKDVPVEISSAPRPGEDALQALVGLGYPAAVAEEIGRASCRGRGVGAGGDGRLVSREQKGRGRVRR